MRDNRYMSFQPHDGRDPDQADILGDDQSWPGKLGWATMAVLALLFVAALLTILAIIAQATRGA